MDLIAIGLAVLRRWYVVLPIIALGAAGAYHVATTSEAEYTAEGTFLLSGNSLDVDEARQAAADRALSADVDGVADSVLMAAVLGLDPRFLAEQGQEGTVFTVSNVDPQTVQVLAWADETDDVDAVLDDLVALAEDSLAPGLGLSAFGRTDPVPAVGIDAVRGDVQAGMLMRITGIEEVADDVEFTADYAGRVLTELMMSRASVDEVMESEPGGEYEVVMQEQDQAPIVTISAVAMAPDDAFDLFSETVAVAQLQLDRIQESLEVPDAQWLVLAPLAEPASAPMTQDHGQRPAIMILGVALAVAAALALAVDAIVRRRRARRSAAEDVQAIEPQDVKSVEPEDVQPEDVDDDERADAELVISDVDRNGSTPVDEASEEVETVASR